MMANTHFSLNHGTDKEYHTNYLNTKYISDNKWMKILYKKWKKSSIYSYGICPDVFKKFVDLDVCNV